MTGMEPPILGMVWCLSPTPEVCNAVNANPVQVFPTHLTFPTDTNQLAGLGLVGERSSQDGTSFRTLVLPRQQQRRFSRPYGEPSRPLISESTSLGSKWVSVTGLNSNISSPFDIYGILPTYLPARIGSHQAVDAAVIYTLESCHAFRLNGALESDAARRAGVTAVNRLRKTVSSCQGFDEEAALIAMVLHYITDVSALDSNVETACRD